MTVLGESQLAQIIFSLISMASAAVTKLRSLSAFLPLCQTLFAFRRTDYAPTGGSGEFQGVIFDLVYFSTSARICRSRGCAAVFAVP